MRRLEVIGNRYGRLVVLSEAEPRISAARPVRFVNVRCDCGTEKEINLQLLRRGSTISCGCYRKEVTGDMARVHGDHGTRLYRIWMGMCARCHIKSATSFEYYGGRDIKVCKDWRDYLNFKQWALDSGYQEDLEIDRINNDGDYTPSNCRWVTHQQQCNNRRSRSK